ncbi:MULTISPECIES: hypothetical protein [unclassified Streptomyces]|uniref:hypothetical protein n=1 Tax=unclassified Streptomyces TaxID=2593676 RepID=UPI00117FA112|nr:MULTISPECIES: hypothetical protein [unclassified Streptomyces]TRO59809.1 hypothetical protein E4K73_32315 [Streptomyces sp. IB201691-2A2]
MLIVDAVLETYVAADFALWPVADSPPDRLLVLSGELSSRELGTAMAVLTSYNKGQRERRPRAPKDSLEQVGRLVATECVVAPGGLRIRDTVTGVTAVPGCCSGLENWRDWLDLMNGDEPWLGHDPTPRIEHAGAVARLWPDGDRPEGLPIELPLAQLPQILGSVQDRLVGFLGAVEAWATSQTPSIAAAVVAKLDEDFAVSAPLDRGQS